ncbi:MAG TPA: hypothetical protein VK875_10235 [Euzebyales bacterium]|nr:hypothetical protein [Euzebyales bacterium]
MHLVLLVRRTHGAHLRAYLRAVDRPYARVPIAGELVMLDDDGEQGQAVDQVSWDNDGAAVLRFAEPPVSHAWLLKAGFDLVYEGGAAAS